VTAHIHVTLTLILSHSDPYSYLHSRLLSHSREDDKMWSLTEVAASHSLTPSLLTSKAVEGVCGGLRL
jgi:hypothetical protein